MYVTFRIIACLALASGSAFAQHHHEMEEHPSSEEADVNAFAAGVAVVAGSFDMMDYAGNYEGVLPSAQWSRGRYGFTAAAGFYRLEKNGANFYGLGDVLVHGQIILVGSTTASAGVIAGVMAPLGDGQHGTGMGHTMVMPALFGTWNAQLVELTASAGYSRAIDGDVHHDHGPWPLVDPMLMSELSWNAASAVRVAQNIRAGGRLSGGIPVGGPGNTRVIGALRASWRTGRVESAAELQGGLAGDPFTVRGVVSTALSF